MEANEFFRRAAAEFGTRVRGVKPDGWHAPTPCAEWDVRALVNHLTYECLWVPELLEGKTIAEVGDRYEGDQLGSDPRGAWEAAKDAAVEAVDRPAALEHPVSVSAGQMSAREYVYQVGTDLFIHAWDLARASGGDEKLDPELVGLVYEMASPHEEEMKATGLFGEQVDPGEDADTQTKLLAIFGRRA